MRVAFVNHCRRKAGGAEIYLDCIISAFARAGHEIAFLHEDDGPADRESISFPTDALCWDLAKVGFEETIKSLRAWHPEVCFTHGLHSVDLEARILQTSPSALYVHNYYGTCISGEKTWSNGTPRPCTRKFSRACLFHYFPHQCGGLNPFTMWQLYQLQSQRLELMHRYTAVIANSVHIQQEMDRHGVHSEMLTYPILSAEPSGTIPLSTDSDELRLLFAGRMTSLKGGQLLLQALPEVSERLGRKLHVVFAGDGPERRRWESIASEMRSGKLTMEFHGWLGHESLHEELKCAHLLIYPSVWPEPFGLSGLEAGCYDVPSVAFAVGGIPEWLHDGVNGHLAAMPASAASLAEAIMLCLADERHYQSLRVGAKRRSSEYQISEHVAGLTRIFERCTA